MSGAATWLRGQRWLRHLKFLLIWPIFFSYRRKLQRSVRWRLADSHFTAVWSSVIGLCLVALIVTTAWARFAFPNQGELRDETAGLSAVVQNVQHDAHFSNQELSTLLSALATGAIEENPAGTEPNLQVNVGSSYRNIRSISIVSADMTVVASSNGALIGQPVAQALPAAADLIARELAASPRGDERLSRGLDGGGAVSTAKLRNAGGNVAGILVLDKSALAYPTIAALIRDAVKLIFQVGFVILIAIGLPAIPIGIYIGIKRGRAISRPITALAKASERFANGDLDTRVAVDCEDEIGVMQSSFNTMATRLQESIARESAQRSRSEELLAANRELVANVSHELRTPVALIRSHLDAIDGDPDDAMDYIRIAVRETDRLEHLVDDLFQLTRLESKRLNLDLTAFDAGSAAREAVEALAEPARREAGILIRAETSGGRTLCLGDRARLVQVLMNLIRNAIRYTPEGGIVLVSTQMNRDDVEIVVRDTASGITPDDLPHVFDRFYRADPSRNRASGGAGLGLAIARELIEAMGGAIEVESVLDEGTAFTIRMPSAAVKPNGASAYSSAGAAST